jgi:hypothetical protein
MVPEVLALLGDGLPRSEAAIITALAGRHPRADALGSRHHYRDPASMGELGRAHWLARRTG